MRLVLAADAVPPCHLAQRPSRSSFPNLEKAVKTACHPIREDYNGSSFQIAYFWWLLLFRPDTFRPLAPCRRRCRESDLLAGTASDYFQEPIPSESGAVRFPQIVPAMLASKDGCRCQVPDTTAFSMSTWFQARGEKNSSQIRRGTISMTSKRTSQASRRPTRTSLTRSFVMTLPMK